MKYLIKSFVNYFLLMILLSISTIHSQDTSRYSVNQLDSILNSKNLKKYPKHKFYITTGGLISLIDGSIIFNSKNLNAGTKLDFEDDLKLDSYDFTYRVGAIYNLSNKSDLSAYFLVMNRSSSITLKDPIQFGENKFDGNTEFNLGLDFSYFGLNYTYNIISEPRYTTGVSAGLRVFNIKTSGSGSVTVNNETFNRTSQSATTEPGFLIGVSNSVYFLPNLQSKSSLEYFHIKLGEITATLAEARIGLEYYIHKNIGIGFLVTANYLKVILESKEDFNGEISYNFKGLSLYVIAGF